MQDNLIDQGISLMLFGMGTVFVFLTVLVFATTFMSKVVNRLVPEDVKNSNITPQAAATNTPAEVSPRALEAIKLAIKAHRSN